MKATLYRKMILLLMIATMGPGVGCTAKTYPLWDVQTKKEVALSSAASRLAGVPLVFVGELHDRLSHHEGQLQIIQTIHATSKPLAVGLEMFPARDQVVLDRWIEGTMEEAEFQKHFQSNWSEDWPLYRKIFTYCRREKIPMVGLNVPREIPTQVAREGFSSLTREQLGMLPPITCNVNQAYMEIMRKAHGLAMSGPAFTQFCEAQLVWDTSMAIHVLEYLRKHEDQTLIVLAGAVHAWKEGIPRQVKELNPDLRSVVILPDVPGTYDKKTVSQKDCDFLLLGV